MSTESSEQLELEIKRLERDKRIEEIKQLKSSGKAQWITPAALTAFIPLLAGLVIWIFGEMKQYNAGYIALQERDKISSEKVELQRQKDSLNIEVSTLLDLKEHYARQAKSLQTKFEERQKQLDTTYIRARFYSEETKYILKHVRPFRSNQNKNILDKLKKDIDSLPNNTAKHIRHIISTYSFALDMIETSQRTLAAFGDTLNLIPASDWAVKLKWHPSGRRNMMVLQSRQGRRYYDVDEGRFLSQDESKTIR